MKQSKYRVIWQRFRRHKMAVGCLVILSVLILMAILAPLIAPYSPTKPAGKFSQPPSGEHILGTDKIGRDMFSRILYAMRVSLLVGFLATAVSTVIGVALGLVSGYFGGAVDKAIMSFTDMVMSFPYILLILVAGAIFEPGMWNIILILGFIDWPGIARLVRGNVLSIKEKDFVHASRIGGMSRAYILFSDILPNTVAPILVFATSVMAISILDEAALSFLGMGVQPPAASLGNMLNGAQSITVLTKLPWLWISPGAVIVLLVVCVNFIGDALRDAIDPSTTKS